MHVHTRGSDGWGTPDEIVQYAQRARLDGVCLTDHHVTYTPESLEVAKALRKAGLLAFHGCEYSTSMGHLLVYGVSAESLDFGYYPHPQAVIDSVSDAGGICIPAHPFKGYKRAYCESVIELKGIPGFETANGQCTYQNPMANQKAAVLSGNHYLRSFGGSDAHNPQDVGLTYTLFQGIIRHEKDLLKAIRDSRTRAVTSKKLVHSRIKSDRGSYLMTKFCDYEQLTM